MTWKPNATVAVVCERDGHFLVIEELSDGKIVINQPAGHIEENETIIDAAMRETLEETGWQVSITDFIGLFTYTSANNNTTYYRFCFAAIADKLVSQDLDEGIIQPLWLTRKEIAEQQERLRSPLVLRCIDAHLSGRRYPLSLIDEEFRFLSDR